MGRSTMTTSFRVSVSEPARHELEGILEIAPTNAFAGSNRFPDFSASFFTMDGYLVPVERDIIRSPSIAWDIILSPGRVWSEPGDNGWSRASFPFVLVGRTFVDSHNGLATFLYNDSKVSDLQFQIVQENMWTVGRFDAWLRVPMTYRPEPVDGRSELASAFERELAQRFPTAPLDVLVSDAELIDIMEHDPSYLVSTALLDDGVLYLSPCYTRFGDYPYCDAMRQQVGSVTKTASAALLALLWLAERYGADVLDLKIVDYVDVTADHDGWQDVTFRDAIDMAAGVGNFATERIATRSDFWRGIGHNLMQFLGRATAREKLEIVFSADNYDWGPGEVVRYNNLHTFVLAAAMDSYLKSVEGPDANLWDRVTEDVLRPMGIPYAPLVHTREPDDSRGLPIMATGFLPTVGDLAKIAQLFQDRGAFDGQQLLYAEEIDMLLQGDPDRGLPVHYWTNEFGQGSYDFAFWYLPYGGAAECQLRLPFMSGAGGNFVVFMPNGMTGIRLGAETAGEKQEAENLGGARE